MTSRPDFPPLTLGELLQAEFLTPLGMSAEELAARAQVSPGLVHDLLAGRTVITPDRAALGQVFGMSQQFWMNVHADHEAEVQADLA